MPHPTAWGWFWLGWALTALGVEAYWLAANAVNTLSEEVWGVEGIDLAHPLNFAEWTPLHWTLALSLWLFFGWLSVHLAFGWLR